MLLTTLLAPLLLLAGATAAKCKTSKRGLAWPSSINKGVPMDAFPERIISAYYTWTETPVANAPFPFIPMLWGCDSASTAAFAKAVENKFAVENYTPELTRDKAILSFSEPALYSQSNCSPAQAAKVWMQHVEPLKKYGYRLGTPAVTIDALGHAWLLEWFVQCRECKPDFMALHWYGTSFDDLQERLEGYREAFKMPIWLTEFSAQNFTNEQHNPDSSAVQPSLLQTTSILNQSMAWLDGTDWVERYFWYGAMYDMQTLNTADSLFDAADSANRTGRLSDLGTMYITDKTIDPKCNGTVRAAVSTASVALALVLCLLGCVI